MSAFATGDGNYQGRKAHVIHDRERTLSFTCSRMEVFGFNQSLEQSSKSNIGWNGLVIRAKRITVVKPPKLQVDGLILTRPTRLSTEPHGLGQPGANGGVVRGDHRVVRRQTPLLAILRRRQIKGSEVPLQRLELLAVLQTHDVIGCNRLFADGTAGTGLGEAIAVSWFPSVSPTRQHARC